MILFIRLTLFIIFFVFTPAFSWANIESLPDYQRVATEVKNFVESEHSETSTDFNYYLNLIEDLQDFINAQGAPFWEEPARQVAEWQRFIRNLNDSALNAVNRLPEQDEGSQRLLTASPTPNRIILRYTRAQLLSMRNESRSQGPPEGMGELVDFIRASSNFGPASAGA